LFGFCSGNTPNTEGIDKEIYPDQEIFCYDQPEQFFEVIPIFSFVFRFFKVNTKNPVFPN